MFPIHVHTIYYPWIDCWGSSLVSPAWATCSTLITEQRWPDNHQPSQPSASCDQNYIEIMYRCTDMYMHVNTHVRPGIGWNMSCAAGDLHNIYSIGFMKVCYCECVWRQLLVSYLPPGFAGLYCLCWHLSWGCGESEGCQDQGEADHGVRKQSIFQEFQTLKLMPPPGDNLPAKETIKLSHVDN